MEKEVIGQPALPPTKRTPGTHLIGVWVDLTAGQEAVEKRNHLCLCRRTSAVQPLA